MMQLDAIIFDMDGVIVDSEPRHELAFREVFQEMGYADSHGIDFTAYYGRSDRALWIDFIDKHKPELGLDELIAWKQSRFLQILERDQPIFETLPELVERLSRRYKLAIASGSYHPVIDAVLAMKDLRRFFPVVVSVQDVLHGKPAPDVFFRAADLMGVPANSCCVIEDSGAGVDAALEAGMPVIAITNTLPANQLSRATHIVSSYGEIDQLLL